MDFLPAKNKNDQNTPQSPVEGSKAVNTPENAEIPSVSANAIPTTTEAVQEDTAAVETAGTAPQAMTDNKTTADPSLAEEVAKCSIPASEDESTKQEKEQIQKIQGGIGINLIPRLTKEEISSEKKKTGVNFVAAFFILLLAFLTIVIVGFNILTKASLNRKKEMLYAKETEVSELNNIVNANNQILDRFNLYSTIEDSSHSPKEILLYWEEVTSKFGAIESVELASGFRFTVKGYATNMTETARLWHLLNVDDRIASIELKSVSKQTDKVAYVFEGNLNVEYFISNQEEE